MSAAVSFLAVTAFAADPCVLPTQRLQKPLLDAAMLDDELALGLEAASNACMPVSEVCEQMKQACTGKLQRANASQSALDAKGYVTDMQTLYLGQRYPMGTLRPMGTDGLTSCAVDVDKLKAAMTKRREMASVRRELATEYGRWGQWLLNIQQRCRGGALPAAATTPAGGNSQAAVVTGVAGAGATAATAAAADAAQRKAQEEAARAAAQRAALEQQQKLEAQRQSVASKEEEARRAKAEADERARKEKLEIDEKLKAQKAEAEERTRRELAASEEKRRQEALAQAEAAAAAAKASAEAEKRRAEEAEAAQKHAAELEADRAARAEAERAVEERERKKEEARKRRDELKEKEAQRREEAKAAREEARKAQAEEHKRRREELQRNWDLTDEERKAKLDAEDARYEEEERQRREKAEAEINAAGDDIDVSDERSGGALTALGVGGYMNLSNGRVTATGLLLGVEISFRLGIWTLAPAAGMSSGFELRVAGNFMSSVGAPAGSMMTFGGTPELRVFWGRFGIGIAFNVQQISSDLVDTPRLATKVTATALGPTLTLALVDDRNVRVLATARWLPVMASLDNVEGELEAGFAAFSLHIRGGKLRALGEDMTFSRSGYFFIAGLGGRLRW